MEGKVKAHEAALEGRIIRLNRGGYGFIESTDGQEVYFHRNALRNEQFERLRKGALVRFSESEIDGLIQASSVHLTGSKQ
jgi:cold shock CspA family protein